MSRGISHDCCNYHHLENELFVVGGRGEAERNDKNQLPQKTAHL